MSAEDCQRSEPVVEAKQTGERGMIAGFDAARATVSLKQSCTDAKSGKTCDMVWTIDQWLASGASGAEESAAFEHPARGLDPELKERARLGVKDLLGEITVLEEGGHVVAEIDLGRVVYTVGAENPIPELYLKRIRLI